MSNQAQLALTNFTGESLGVWVFDAFGAILWNSVHNTFSKLPIKVLKRNIIDILLSIMINEDDYAGVSLLLQKIAKKF